MKKRILLLTCILLYVNYLSAQSDVKINEPFLSRNFPVSSINELEVNTSYGNITVTGDAVSEAIVEVFITKSSITNNGVTVFDGLLGKFLKRFWGVKTVKSNDDINQSFDENYIVTIELKDGKLFAISEQKKDVLEQNQQYYSVSFKISVPQYINSNLNTTNGYIKIANLSGKQELKSNYGSLKIEESSGNISGKTSNGSINISYSKDNIDLSTKYGNIKANSCQGDITLKSSNGSLKLNDLDGKINISTGYGSISVDNVSGSIIGKSSNGGIKVSNTKEEIDLTTSYGNISAIDCSGKITLNTNNGSLKLNFLNGTINANSGYGGVSVDNVSGNITVKTTNGNIKVTDTKNNINLTTGYGSISAKYCSGKIMLQSKTGGISLDNISGNIEASTNYGAITAFDINGTLLLTTSNGGIKLDAISGSVEAKTSFGNINLTMDKVNDYVKLTNRGSVNITLPQDKGYNMNVKAEQIEPLKVNNFSGTMNSKNIDGIIDNGGPEIEIKTSGRVNMTF
ncbi:MAG: hypothetical protein FWH18_10035 [Marinilabiliaceae bacterium]|nr:hypothetical protein [Marinilabiliaceae bacterium]